VYGWKWKGEITSSCNTGLPDCHSLGNEKRHGQNGRAK
jgi:hypothetical protein